MVAIGLYTNQSLDCANLKEHAYISTMAKCKQVQTKVGSNKSIHNSTYLVGL
jgi:hypothetical protein